MAGKKGKDGEREGRGMGRERKREGKRRGGWERKGKDGGEKGKGDRGDGRYETGRGMGRGGKGKKEGEGKGGEGLQTQTSIPGAATELFPSSLISDNDINKARTIYLAQSYARILQYLIKFLGQTFE